MPSKSHKFNRFLMDRDVEEYPTSGWRSMRVTDGLLHISSIWIDLNVMDDLGLPSRLSRRIMLPRDFFVKKLMSPNPSRIFLCRDKIQYANPSLL